MSEKNLMPEAVEMLLKTAVGLFALADSVRALCSVLADGPKETEKPEPEKKAEPIKLETVRAALAEKERQSGDGSMIDGQWLYFAHFRGVLCRQTGGSIKKLTITPILLK